MSETTDTQETFISHLIELRTRLMRSIIAVVVVLLCLFPFAKDIYALLAAAAAARAAAGATMIATDVTGTFLVPLKVTLMAAFLIALPVRALPGVGVRRARASTSTRSGSSLPVIVSSCVFFVSAWRSRTSSCSRSRSASSPATRRSACR